MKKLLVISVLACVTLSFASAGAKLYKEKLCSTCHGPTGAEPLTGDYPKLVGQNYKYLVKQTKFIRDGKRKSGLSVTMKATIGKISNEDIKKISKWLSKGPAKKSKGSVKNK